MSESTPLTKKGSVLGSVLSSAGSSVTEGVKDIGRGLADRRTNLTETWAEQVGKGGVLSAAVMTPVLVDSKEYARIRGVAARATGLVKEEGPAPTEAALAMPTEDTEAVAEARRRQRVAMRARGGRASTILTDTLGG